MNIAFTRVFGAPTKVCFYKLETLLTTISTKLASNQHALGPSLNCAL